MAKARGRSIVRYVKSKRGSHKQGKQGFTIPLAVVAGFAPLAHDTMTEVKVRGPGGIPHVLAYHLTGVNTWDNNKFNSQVLINGWTPILAGFLVHKLAGKFGINQMLAKAGVPILRI